MKQRLLLPFIFIICLQITSCNFFQKAGGLGVSNSVDEAIQKQVFIQEYKSLQNPSIINDSLSVYVESAWLESVWRYAGKEAQDAEIEKDSSCQLIIISNDESLKGFNENWQIEKLDFSKDYFYPGYLNSIVGTFNSIPKNDTLILKLFRNRNPKEITKKNYLGKIKLVRKENSN